MARIRYLKPDFFKDEDIARLPYETRLFYAGMWVLADREGRLEDRPERLKVEIFPYDNIRIEKCLEQLAQTKPTSKRPFINRYSVNGERYIQIVGWNKHQKPHHTEKKSTIPPDPSIGMVNGDGKRLSPVKQPLNNGDITVKQPLIQRNPQNETENKEINTPPILAKPNNKIKSISEQIQIDRSFGKCCYLCGQSKNTSDSGKFKWKERLPFCYTTDCYERWVKLGKPEPEAKNDTLAKNI